MANRLNMKSLAEFSRLIWGSDELLTWSDRLIGLTLFVTNLRPADMSCDL